MIRRLTVAAAIILSFVGGFAAFGGGPMSPTRPMTASQVPAGDGKAAEVVAPPQKIADPPSFADTTPAAANTVPSSAAAPGTGSPVAVASIPPVSKDPKPAEADASDKAPAAEAQPQKRRPQHAAATRSYRRAQPNHMVLLNRMQVRSRFAYASVPYTPGFGPAPYSALGGN